MITAAIAIHGAAESTGVEIREWAIAVGTIAAAVAAVYVGPIRDYRRRPRLSLLYGGTTGTDATIVEVGNPPREVAYIRLRVAAARGKLAAEEVEVMVLGARELTHRRDFLPRVGNIAIEGQMLAWSNCDPPTTRLTIPSGAQRHIDLVWAERSHPGTGPAVIAVEPVPTDSRHLVKSGEFELELELSARNADSRRERVIIRYDGDWGDNVWAHLSAQVVGSE